MRPYLPDLHLHSTASDGLFSPMQVAQTAQKLHVNLIALTDHDTLNGLAEAQSQCETLQISMISGVELSTGGDNDIHVLGYGVHEGMKPLQALLETMRQDRENRARSILERLSALGMPLEYDHLDVQPGKSVGRPSIARGMIEYGYVATVREAFDRYLGIGLPAYVPREKISSGDAIAMLRAQGAVPVLAHPGLLRFESTALLPLLSEWQEAGLMGIEVYHPCHTPEAAAKWNDWTRARGLLVTGGSDNHGDTDGHAPIGSMIAKWTHCDTDADELLRTMISCRQSTAK